MKRYTVKLIHIPKKGLSLEKQCEMICYLNADVELGESDNYICKVIDEYDERYYIDEQDELYLIKLEDGKDSFETTEYGYQFDIVSSSKGLQEIIDDKISK